MLPEELRFFPQTDATFEELTKGDPQEATMRLSEAFRSLASRMPQEQVAGLEKAVHDVLDAFCDALMEAQLSPGGAFILAILVQRAVTATYACADQQRYLQALFSVATAELLVQQEAHAPHLHQGPKTRQ